MRKKCKNEVRLETRKIDISGRIQIDGVQYLIPETNNKQEEQKGEKVKRRTSLKNIIGGDILATDFFRRQTKLLVLIMVLILFYIHNRYACQQQMIEIDKLKKELIDIKYDALTRSSELMERSRQSRIEEYIATKESDLQTSTNPPYLIK